MVGQNIGKYHVMDRIGRGGMGTVYRATDETLRRDVAIKVLNAELNDPEVAKRFRAEAITVARLSHPGIATIYELFQHEGQWLMVMEFVRGETLEHLVERMGALSPQRTAELCMQTLAALAHAHSMGVVHRDLKPANIMITETGAIKVMDFGIARVAGTEHLTSAGFMMGTPAYMAPEQVMGHEIDARADLYAMGVVFYRLTTAKLPFKGDTPFAMAQSQVNDPPTPMGTFRTDLPAWVEQVVVRALAKSPEERFQSAVEFHEAFARCLAGLPILPVYNSSAPTELLMTPSRAMPAMSTGSIQHSVPSASLPPSTVPLVHQTGAQADSHGVGGVAPQVSAPTPVSQSQAVSANPPTASVGPAESSGAPPVEPPPAAPPVVASALPKKPDAAKPGAAKKKSSVGLIAAAAVAILLGGGGSAFWVMSHRPPAPPPPEAAPLPPIPDVPVAPPTGGATASPDIAPPVPTPPSSATAAPPAAARPTASASTSAQAPGDARGAAPAASTAPAATPAAPAVDDSHQAFTDVRLLVVNGRKASDQDVVLSFVGGQIAVLGKTGSAIAGMPYKSVVHATYIHARDPKWDDSGAASAPPANLDVGGVLRTSKHWLVLQAKDSYLILRLADGNWNRILETVEARAGLAVDRPKSSDKP